ncbi:MAG: Nif3-like dinuclear metal center hexameric protein [Methylobacterium sp.]|nr:Nif3-like dinuclear metal center hexameric protein [Methylobacterium sp.]
MKLTELVDYTGRLLQVERWRDYCPNGLQVQGRPEVLRVVSGVSASKQLLEAALAANADLVLVHHGYFWKGEDARIVGVKHDRLRLLLQHDLNLVAYHLPLDAHPELGNNAQLARLLGFDIEGWFGEQPVGAYGRWREAAGLGALGRRVEQALGRTPLMVGAPDQPVRRIAWCSGAAQDYLQQAVDLGVDAFLTGEISEHSVHLARESGVAFIAAGHHATERYGVRALGDHLAEQFGLTHQFIDLDNPV